MPIPEHDRALAERAGLIGSIRRIVETTCTEIGPAGRRQLIDQIEEAADDAYHDVLETYEEQVETPSARAVREESSDRGAFFCRQSRGC